MLSVNTLKAYLITTTSSLAAWFRIAESPQMYVIDPTFRESGGEG
jgi:hypothetical protein